MTTHKTTSGCLATCALPSYQEGSTFDRACSGGPTSPSSATPVLSSPFGRSAGEHTTELARTNLIYDNEYRFNVFQRCLILESNAGIPLCCRVQQDGQLQHPSDHGALLLVNNTIKYFTQYRGQALVLPTAPRQQVVNSEDQTTAQYLGEWGQRSAYATIVTISQTIHCSTSEHNVHWT